MPRAVKGPAARAQRPPISQADVVAAAADVADRGMELVTMPAVAARLGVTPMALYHHVVNKEHLLSLLMDSLLSSIEVPPAGVRWDQRLRRYHLEIVAAMTRYPGLIVEVDTDHMARLLDGYLQILLEAGFEPVDAGKAYTGLYFLAMGNQQRRFGLPSPVAAPPTDPANRATAAVAEVAASVPDDQWHEFALDAYLEGLRRLRKPGSRRRRSEATELAPRTR